MSVITRPARRTDLDELVAIENSVFAGDRLSRRTFRTLMTRPTALILVVQTTGRIAGYAALLFRKASVAARLYSIAVAPWARGIGRGLLAAAEDAAIRMNLVAMRLEVREDNARAIGLYAKAGYRAVGREPDYYADGSTALRFRKDLTTANAAAPPG